MKRKRPWLLEYQCMKLNTNIVEKIKWCGEKSNNRFCDDCKFKGVTHGKTAKFNK